ncbi:MAG: hypothetical protein J7L44_03625 [Candidatus Diapherotrites archaeon]|nr:hypothetical protein [Candidatus Diapherotrites archaeon]
MIGILITLIIMGLFALSIGMIWLAALFFISAIAYLVAFLFEKSVRFTARVAKSAGAGIKKELEVVGKADTAYPAGALSETLKEVGRKTGEATFDEYGVWSSGETSKAFRAKLGKSTKNFINKFLSLFK